MVPLSTTSTGTDDIPAASTALWWVPLIDAVAVRHSTRSPPLASKAARKAPGGGCEVVGAVPPARNRA